MMKTNVAMIICFMIAGLFSSCQKSMEMMNIETIEKTPVDVLVTAYSWPHPENPGNPYDSVGIWHNAILASTVECMSGRREADSEVVARCVRQYGLNVWGMEMSETGFASMMESVMQERDNQFEQVFENSTLNENVKMRMRRIWQIVRGPGSDNWWESYGIFKQVMMDYEHEVLNDVSLTGTDKRVILCASSVARHSMYYWMNHTIPTDENTNPTARSFFKSMLMKIAAVTGDIGGAIGGMLDDSASLQDVAAQAAGSSAFYRDIVIYSMP